ncbi:MAG: hypothetical protein A2020_07915 [Lentisphaerae bacterium GWF2_45_14]|nr:MAG: hypothetical protein A2020_07915 [Lentisphaerae bacterium GWF2_45_14]
MNKYQRTIEAELKQIRLGKKRVGAKIDSIRSLARQYSISLSTVVRVVNELKNLGVIEAKPGSGCFVARTEPEERPARPLNNGRIALFHSYTRERILAGQNYDVEILSHAENALCEFGLSVEVVPYPTLDGQLEFIKEYINSNKDVKGVLLFRMSSAECTRETLIYCEKHGVQTVCLSEIARSECLNIPTVAIDNFGGGSLGMDILIEKGVERPGIILPCRLPPTDYFQIAKGAELTWINSGNSQENLVMENSAKDCMQWTGYNTTKKLIEERPETDGIIYTHHFLAEGGIEYLSENKILIGSDIHVVGIPRWKADAFWGPSETSWIHYPYDQVGKQAGRVLGQRIAGTNDINRIRIQPQIDKETFR